jgi:4-hydroxybenzoate polyprenyltransferase
MKKYTSLFHLKMMTCLILIAMFILPIITRLEGKKYERWYFSLFLLGCSLMIIYTVIKSIDDRLKKIEKQMESKELLDDNHE